MYKVAKKSTKSTFSSTPSRLRAPIGKGSSPIFEATRKSRLSKRHQLRPNHFEWRRGV